jgi:hypothetical protein
VGVLLWDYASSSIMDACSDVLIANLVPISVSVPDINSHNVIVAVPGLARKNTEATDDAVADKITGAGAYPDKVDPDDDAAVYGSDSTTPPVAGPTEANVSMPCICSSLPMRVYWSVFTAVHVAAAPFTNTVGTYVPAS